MKTRIGSRQKINVSALKGAALREEADTGVLSTGIPQLDLLLSGGVPRGKITEIVGTSSSGKTSSPW